MRYKQFLRGFWHGGLVGILLCALWLLYGAQRQLLAVEHRLATGQQTLLSQLDNLTRASITQQREQLQLLTIDEQALALQQHTIRLHTAVLVLMDEQFWLLSQKHHRRPELPMPASLRHRLAGPKS